MTEEKRWPLAEARAVALDLVALLTPYSERIIVAGSIRRGSPDVGDIEILAVPQQPGIFEFGCYKLLMDGVLAKRPDIRGRTTYGLKNKLLRHMASGIDVDIFTTPAENWGMALVVRTGPREWNIRMMAMLKARGGQGHAYGGIALADGTEVSCPTEKAVFEHLGWPYISPQGRE